VASIEIETVDSVRKSILECVPKGITLRKVQKDFLLWAEREWDNNKVFVGKMPVGSGKSICAITLSEWMEQNDLGRCFLITPTKILQDQYCADFEWVPLLKGATNYTCTTLKASNPKDNLDCRVGKRVLGKYCPNCPYREAVQEVKGAPAAIANFHSYFANHIGKEHLIMDEGHNAANFIYSIFGTNLWQCETQYDPNVEITQEYVQEVLRDNIDDLRSAVAEALTTNNHKLADDLEDQANRYELVCRMLSDYPADKLILKKKKDRYPKNGKVLENRGKESEFLFIKPIEIGDLSASALWPEKDVDKVIFLSATIGETDMELLGLSKGNKIAYFECDSPIPPENRPISPRPVANMSYRNRPTSVPIVARACQTIADKLPNEKGIIHCTYQMGQELRKTLKDKRFMFHESFNKKDIYNAFKYAEGNKVLIASGMSEGIDLPDDAARWQIITQVMYPNLSDDVNMWYCKNAHHIYQWEAVRIIEQQVGRVCRHPNDFGRTIILDMQFNDLFYKTHTCRIRKGQNSMWSKSFLEAMDQKWMEENGLKA
jgi:Rad3-related DNA helicase